MGGAWQSRPSPQVESIWSGIGPNATSCVPNIADIAVVLHLARRDDPAMGACSSAAKCPLLPKQAERSTGSHAGRGLVP